MRLAKSLVCVAVLSAIAAGAAQLPSKNTVKLNDIPPIAAPQTVVEPHGSANVTVDLAPAPVAHYARRSYTPRSQGHRVMAAPAVYRSSSPASKVALIVGISNAPGADPLPGSKTDALTMRKALLMYGFPARNITMLLDGQATRGAILGALDNLAHRSMSSGIAVVSITTHSSHGSGGTSMRAWNGRVYANELGNRLGRVRGRLFTILPTCYSGGYAVPGVIGANRIAVFSSTSDDRSWQVGEAGSWVVRYMIQKGMIEGGAPDSVESAFAYSVRRLKETAPDRVPIMRDGISGTLQLGPVTWNKPAAAKPKPKPPTTVAAAPVATPAPTPATVNYGGLLGGLFGHH